MPKSKKVSNVVRYQKLVQDISTLEVEEKQRAVLLYSLKQLDTKRRLIFKYLYTDGLSMQAAGRLSMKKTVNGIDNKAMLENASRKMLELLKGETLGFDLRLI